MSRFLIFACFSLSFADQIETNHACDSNSGAGDSCMVYVDEDIGDNFDETYLLEIASSSRKTKTSRIKQHGALQTTLRSLANRLLSNMVIEATKVMNVYSLGVDMTGEWMDAVSSENQTGAILRRFQHMMKHLAGLGDMAGKLSEVLESTHANAQATVSAAQKVVENSGKISLMESDDLSGSFGQHLRTVAQSFVSLTEVEASTALSISQQWANLVASTDSSGSDCVGLCAWLLQSDMSNAMQQHASTAAKGFARVQIEATEIYGNLSDVSLMDLGLHNDMDLLQQHAERLLGAIDDNDLILSSGSLQIAQTCLSGSQNLVLKITSFGQSLAECHSVLSEALAPQLNMSP